MTKPIKEKEKIDAILDKSIPDYRQAYSDRTCWIMSYLSELAYYRFEPLFKNDKKKKLLSKLIDKSEDVLEKRKDLSVLKQVIDSLVYDEKEEKKKLISELKDLRMSLIDTFANDKLDTQAILIGMQDKIVLSFRGTEAMSFKDMKTDFTATLVPCETGGGIHEGFDKAYNGIIGKIEARLAKDDVKDKVLYLSGHSLGGALAVIAAKKLKHGAGLAACYTFGMPRVGDAKWITGIKTPIYRVVNAVDGVTMLPFGDLMVTVVKSLLGFIPKYGTNLKEKFSKNYEGYMHCGNMRYLTDCRSGDYSNLQLLYSVSGWYRAKQWWKSKFFKGFLKDHSIAVYRKKLLMIAERNNK